MSDGVPRHSPETPLRPATPTQQGAADRSASSEGELFRRSLSDEAERLRSGLGLPVTMLPPARTGTRPALATHTLAMNLLIGGELPDSPALALLRPHLDGSLRSRVESLCRLRFDGFWSHDDVAELLHGGEDELEARWRRSLERGDRWAGAAETLRRDLDYASLWRSLPVGDFDVEGRGRDYTQGMAYFQAARAFGIESLLPLFRGPGGAGLVLDVLGGDGYILRIRQASGKLAEGNLWTVPVSRDLFPSLDSANGGALADRLAATLGGVAGALVLAVEGETAEISAVPPGNAPLRGRLLVLTQDGLSASAPFDLASSQLQELDRRGLLARPRAEAPATDLEQLLLALREGLKATPAAHLPEVVTNDLSPHMFRSAGLWGMPTREDARRLSRTFRPQALDGVLFAYGTHHVPEFFTAVQESWAVVRPGGRIVAHDFLDEGRVGRWFHEVVHRHSRTGHDFAHLGLVEMATYLYLAGFRYVELYEMEDPFVFALPPGSRVSARDIACTYLLGMYGMTESFRGRRDRFESVVREILSYPEVDGLPLFDDDFVYVPRRAVVATARRPEPGEPELSPADRELVARLTAIFSDHPRRTVEGLELPPEVERTWFPGDGSRWGVSREIQERWLERFGA